MTTLKAAKAAVAASSTTMLDDQKALMHVLVMENGVSVPLAPGQSLSWSVVEIPAITKVDATVDIKGAPSTDPLAAVALGIKGTAGSSTISASLTNPDGTVSSVDFPFTITLDPAELDAVLTGTVDAPVVQ